MTCMQGLEKQGIEKRLTILDNRSAILRFEKAALGVDFGTKKDLSWYGKPLSWFAFHRGVRSVIFFYRKPGNASC